MRKIVHIVSSLGRGGAEKFVVDLLNEIASNTLLDVTLISLFANNEKSLKSSLSDNVKLIELGKRRPGPSINTFLKLARVIGRLTPDVVHSHTSALAYALPLTAISRRRVFFHTLHSDAFFEATGFSRFARQIAFRSKAITPVAISRSGATSATALYGVSNFPTIPNGVLTPQPNSADVSKLNERYRISSGVDIIFFTAGRVDQNKNHLALLQAICKLRTEGWKCTLLLAGRIQEEAVFAELMGLATADPGSLCFLGEIGNVSSHMAICDAFCLSSLVEGFPITILEAMSMSVIPVCTPAGGVPEAIVDGVTGFLADGFSSDQLAEALKRFLAFKDKERMRNSIEHQFQSCYTIQKCAASYRDHYISALTRQTS